jgi:ribosomal protein S27AE
MRKRDELTNPNSCMSRAKDGEMVFVLLGRDMAAPSAIRSWADNRVRLGKNKRDDAQIVEALHCADTMEREREEARRAAPATTAVDSSNPTCKICGSIMNRNGSCYACGTCGWTSGCS